jgi:Ser/Thr protein kinase RdoA (MazF antagonist)
LWSAQPGQAEWHHTFAAADARRAGNRIRAALEWAARMAAATADGVITAREWLGAWPLVRAQLLASGLDRAAAAHFDHRLPAVWDTPWPAALVHGDFFAGNLLFQRDRVSGVLDWGGAEARGPAFVDALSYELAFALHGLGAQGRMNAGALRAFADLPPFRQERRSQSAAGGIPTQPGAAARLVAVAGRMLREVQAGPARRAAAQAWMRLATLEAEIAPA